MEVMREKNCYCDLFLFSAKGAFSIHLSRDFQAIYSIHCGYHRYYHQGLRPQCALVAAVRGGQLT